MLSKIKNLIFKKKDEPLDKFLLFVGLVENYLKREHPKITFDYSIKDELKDEENLKVKKSLFISDIIRQFAEFSYERKTQKSVDKNMLWSGYGANSQPNLKQPHDFSRRRELIFLRDKATCNRCGNTIDDIKNMLTIFVQDIKDGGGYNIENITCVCFSCYQVLSNSDKNYTQINIALRDKLYDLV